MSFKDSLRINDQDPLVFNEIAVVYYKQKNYDAAKEELSRALSLCHDSANNSQTYETILLNLAHCQRKLQEWDDAIETYHRCLQLNPKNP